MREHNRDYWEGMYTMPLNQLPWEIKETPLELKDYVESHKNAGGKALDIGCGTGNFSLYLAQHGFEVTGIDFSENAVEIARQNKPPSLPIRYIQGDIMELEKIVGNNNFDLLLDYKVLHHLLPQSLSDYVSQCSHVLKPGGRILLVCYSDKDDDATGKPSAIGKFGNRMYYHSADRIREIYKGHDLKEISYQEVMLGKHLNHFGHCFVFEKG